MAAHLQVEKRSHAPSCTCERCMGHNEPSRELAEYVQAFTEGWVSAGGQPDDDLATRAMASWRNKPR